MASVTLTPFLTVKDARAAVEFYRKAFGATEISRQSSPSGQFIIEMSIDGERFYAVDENPPGLQPQSDDPRRNERAHESRRRGSRRRGGPSGRRRSEGRLSDGRPAVRNAAGPARRSGRTPLAHRQAAALVLGSFVRYGGPQHPVLDVPDPYLTVTHDDPMLREVARRLGAEVRAKARPFIDAAGNGACEAVGRRVVLDLAALVEERP